MYQFPLISKLSPRLTQLLGMQVISPAPSHGIPPQCLHLRNSHCKQSNVYVCLRWLDSLCAVHLTYKDVTYRFNRRLHSRSVMKISYCLH